MTRMYDHTGIIHFHSEYSFDGRIPVMDIMQAARAHSIDFLMLTDHSCLDARRTGMEGWHEGVLLIVGQEIAPRFNHYIAFGIDETVMVDEDDDVPPQDYIDKVKDKGGFGFIAHPDHEGTEMFHVKHFPWMDWTVSGYTGVGIWDFMTDWQDSLSNFPKALCSYLFPAFFLKGPRPVTLQRWDDLNKQSKVVGIGELDNHDTPRRVCGINVSVFPFKRAFRFIRTHLLTNTPLQGEPSSDIAILFDALRRGRVYIAMEYFRNARGFSFVISDGTDRAFIGDEFVLKESAAIRVEVPTGAKIRIVKDGKIWRERIAPVLESVIAEQGIYRVEVFLRKWGTYRPWIFSNPIYVKI